MPLISLIIPTPIGDILAVATPENLVLLEFSDSSELDYKKIKLENVY